MGQGKASERGRYEEEAQGEGDAGKECLISDSRMESVLPIGCMRAWVLWHARMYHTGRAASAGVCRMHASMHGSRMRACTASYATA